VKLAQAYVERKQYDKAINEYLGIAVDMPYSASPFVFASQILIEQNKLNEAEPLLERANELEANAFVKKMLGAIKVNKKDYESGIRLLKESVRLNASDPQAWYNLSGGYALNQQFQEAKDAASKVRELNPNFPGLQAWMRQLEQIK
jgi:predicted Zn-dependent protease